MTAGPFNWFGIKRVKDSIDDTPDFWNRCIALVPACRLCCACSHVVPVACCRYQEDIANAKKLGCNSFRFSLEWARIEPKQGQIDHSAIKRCSKGVL